MIQSASLFGNKGFLFAFLIGLSTLAIAQPRKPKPSLKTFLDTQWWLGFRFGTNYSNPLPGERYAVFSPVDYEVSDLKKDYSAFSLPGGQAGLEVAFYHKGFSIALQPTFKIMRYEYHSRFAWASTDASGELESDLHVQQQLAVIEVPLVVKYDLLKDRKIRPFVLAGMQYSFVVGGQKKATQTYTDHLGSVPQKYEGGQFSIGNKDQLSNFYGALGGVGVSFDYWNIRTILEGTYLYGLSSATAKGNPYQENDLVSLGDVNDELKITNINISLSLVFPLRYIDKTFVPY